MDSVAASTILVDRVNIGVFGKTNAGKSTVTNLLTNQETSIVDEKAGTTADVVRAVLEIHDFGAVKLFDTAGLDERSPLGEKKRFKTLQALKECDLVLLVVDPVASFELKDFSVENEVAELCKQYEKQLFIVYNVFASRAPPAEQRKFLEYCNASVFNAQRTKQIVVDASAPDAGRVLVEFVKANYVKVERKIELLPFLKPNAFVALNVPIDEETPAGRLLRPQNAVLDFLLRRLVPFAGYRMDLNKARSEIEGVRDDERKRFLAFLRSLEKRGDGEPGLQLVVTDSQAIDVVDAWTPPEIPVTTFSIIMINYQSGGNLRRFVDGLKAVKKLQQGDKIMVAEACNHDRKCEDIGTVQIPRRLKHWLGFDVGVEFVFGREFPPEDELAKYKLLVHCGGCMVDSQKVRARITDLTDLRIPVTNYGLLLSFLNGESTLARVLAPWGLKP